LLKFIGDFANWDFASDKAYLDAGRALIRAAHPEETPLIVDPFSGGGSIPLEALRLGCDAFASDLNPVACLILKVMLEDIPRRGPELADELRHVGAEVKANAEKELVEFYPADADGAHPIVYIWARTVRCESPNCGAEIPLMRSFWLSKKANNKYALRHRVLQSKKGPPSVEFEIFEPQKEQDVISGTVSQAKARCLCCGTILPPERVRAQIRDQRGGANAVFNGRGVRVGGARLMAVVTTKQERQRRNYRLPTAQDYETVWKATKEIEKLSEQMTLGQISNLPDEPLPSPMNRQKNDSAYFNFIPAKLYGLQIWADLFSARQKLALVKWQMAISEQCSGRPSYVIDPLALALSRVAMCGMSLTNWNAYAEKMQHVFGRQALPMVWDFAEVVSLQHTPGAWQNALDLVVDFVSIYPTGTRSGQVQIADAIHSSLPDAACSIWFTDPPYYDAVPYSHISDFFFVWLKRILPGHPLLRDPYDPDNPLSNKTHEIIEDLQLLRGVPKDKAKELGFDVKDRKFFEESMAAAFAEGHRVLSENGIACVVFAHKTTEGWEALLTGMSKAGWTITGSWPIATEMSSRLRARESSALATSVHLVCRPRTSDDIGDWSDVVRELPRRVAGWMERLQREGLRGADLVFACIGPALEIYSRYAKVVDAQDREIPLGGNPEATDPYQRGYLAYVWEVVGRAALEQVLGTAEARARNGAAGALEEDARLTALFLWTMQSTSSNEPISNEPVSQEDDDSNEDEDESPKKKSTKGFSLVFDVVRRFAQPLGIHLQDWEGRIIETDKGIVRLLAVIERAQQLFGEEGATAVASELEENPTRAAQLSLALFPEERNAAPDLKIGKRRRGISANVSDDSLRPQREATTLDRVHAAMLLQQSGRANALRALLQAEQERGANFLRLANSLSALYPRDSEEKRLLDAMLLAVPR
jgi:adenine-specific DNA methylase